MMNDLEAQSNTANSNTIGVFQSAVIVDSTATNTTSCASGDSNNTMTVPLHESISDDRTKYDTNSDPMKNKSDILDSEALPVKGEKEDAILSPLMLSKNQSTASSVTNDYSREIRSRKRLSEEVSSEGSEPNYQYHQHQSTSTPSFYNNKPKLNPFKQCCANTTPDEIRKNILRNTITFMNFMAKLLFWCSLVLLIAGVVWYSKELALHGTDAHLIAWFSAGAFVILGFPISIFGILKHLTNYYQPNIQCYVVRILWMVPIYSIESWLCLRFHEFAIYIETLRDCYESYVLYCFLQFLIEVLGGEESLILMLKDKSPTRGVHYSPLHWFMKPWIMGQPASSIDIETGQRTVRWTSPFFKQCKLGCLQYVLLKLVCTMAVLILEHINLYKEGDFTPKGGYLYICILTNTSQCWALYCLVFFYYATKNELGPIRPVGKFLAVKSLVFFTWWQALGISMLHEMKLIPSYEGGGWSSEEVARGLQAYLICIEMFIAAILHLFIFPHTDYLKPIAISCPNQGMRNFKGRRVGRRFNNRRMMHYKDDCSKTSDAPSMHEFEPLVSSKSSVPTSQNIIPMAHRNSVSNFNERSSVDIVMPSSQATTALAGRDKQQRKGFVHALIDSTLPRDVMDNTVAIARGDFHVEKKTLLYHAAASDQYSLFANRRKALTKKNKDDVDKSSDSSGDGLELKRVKD